MPVSKLSHPELISKSAMVSANFNRETFEHMLSLLPTPDFYSELHERYETSFVGSLKGDPEKIKACEENRQLIAQNLSILMGLAKVVTMKDPSVLQALGLTLFTEKPVASRPVLQRPKAVRITFDKQGHPQATVTKVMGAKGYEIWACNADPSREENWRLLVWSTKCQKIDVPGLNRTVLNWLRVRGKRGDIVGPWSNPISLDP